MKLVPGVTSFVNGQVAGPGGLNNIYIDGARGNQHNLTIDGVTNVDMSSNGAQHVALNIETVAEFKVLTANYQAEYGRSAGGDIRVVTRSGGSQFHGSGFIFHRHEGLNANSFFDNADGLNRRLYRYNYAGYTLGGPVKLPKNVLNNKLFFFWSQDWAAQLLPASSIRRVRVPTKLELAGDFSETRDGNGKLITIKDPDTGKPFPNNRIPANQMNPSGLAILKLFNRFENVTDDMPVYNHISAISTPYPRRQETARMDYNLSERVHIFGRYTHDIDKQTQPYGAGNSIPLTPTIFKQGPAVNAALNVTTMLSSTLTNEFMFGRSGNHVDQLPQDANAATFAGIGLSFRPPFPYPANQFVNISFSGGANQTYGAIGGYSAFPFRSQNTLFDITDNVSKVWGPHLLKTGVYIQRGFEDKAAGTSMTLNFNNGAAGHPFASALLGNFSRVSQPVSGNIIGKFRSTNVEGFVQDNWRASGRLTLDYGVRFAWLPPQYDQLNQTSFFNPALYDPSKAFRLYLKSGSGKAYDPANPSVLLSSDLVGLIVPGSGDFKNGFGRASEGYYRGGVKDREVQVGPSFGFAFDVFGDGRTVLRGGYRLGYDRMSSNQLASLALENPPAVMNPRFPAGDFDTIGSLFASGTPMAPVSIVGADPFSKLPSVQSFSLQLQRDLGRSMVLSTAYVGSLSRHLSQQRNLNYSAFGEAFMKESQDPTLFPGGIVPDSDATIAQVYKDAGLKFDGSKALGVELLRRYPGYRSIDYVENAASSNYHSMQVSLQRRGRSALTYGVAYTWSKAMGTVTSDTSNADPICSRCYDYRRLSFNRAHVLAINYVWNLPKFSSHFGNNTFVKYLLDGWELAGISQFATGQPAEVTLSIPNVTSLGQRITGSLTETARPQLTGDTTGRRTRDSSFDYTAVRLPDIGSMGRGPRLFLTRPGINVSDISIYKNISLGAESSRRLQLRAELFNAFNHAQFDSVNTAMSFKILPDFSDYVSNQQASPATVFNTRGGSNPPVAATDRLGRAVGEVSGQPSYVSSGRVIQLALKLYF
jgi:hypothetical protein